MPLRDRPTRRAVRLPGWDYRSPGWYAVTLVTQHREWFFGKVVDHQVMLNDPGIMVAIAWREVITAMPGVLLDDWVVMPNHLHAIIRLSATGPVGNHSLSDVVHRFKSVTTMRYSKGVHLNDWQPFDRTLWQPRFYDHIIRDDVDLARCRRYIAVNPANWEIDPDRDPDEPRSSGD